MKRVRGKEIKGKGTKDAPKAKIYIFTEGSTEEIYLNHFNTKEYNTDIIPVDPEHTDAIGIVKFAKNYISNEKINVQYGDRGYCVFDSDPASNPDIQVAFDLVRGGLNKGIRCIFSNPSFEVWFMLHIKDNPPHGLNAEQMKSRLKKELKGDFPNYSETTDIFDWLKDKQDLAVIRAKKLHNSQEKVHERVLSHECNPYTNIFEFMDYMNNIKKENLKI